MKRLGLLLAASWLILPAMAGAAEMSAYGTTLIRFSQQSTPGFEKQSLAPATQYLGLDAAGLADGNLSVNFYGWERVDLQNRSSDDGRTEGTVSSAYLKYLFPRANGEIRAGRFMLLEGVAREPVDGISAAADLHAGLRLSLFGGKPSAIGLDNDARGDWLAGSRLSYNFAGRSELGVSFLHAGNSPSKEITLGTERTVADRRELLGGDIWLSPFSAVTLGGRTSYNTVTSGIAENDYTLAVKPARNVTISANFSERNMKDLYSGTNLPSLFKPDSADKVRNLGGAVTITAGKPLALTLDYRRTKRSTYVNIDRYGGEIRLAEDKLLTGGLSYHRVSVAGSAATGPETPLYDPSYHEIRGWFLHDNGAFTASLDAIGHFYDDKNNPGLYGEAAAFEVIASTGFRPLSYLSISGDVSYGQNSLNKSEFRGLVRAEFSAAANLKGVSK